MHLLVIEDERALCETIVRSLRRLAYSVDYCYDGEKALELLGVERYDLVLLDLNLPKKDGMTVLRTLRQTDRETRVLILSARSEVEDKVQGLDAGANDYLAKPFHLAELEARIRSLTLRKFTQQDVLLTCGGLTFDTRSRTAAVNGQMLTLTRKETGILEYLMVHQGRPVSQEELIAEGPVEQHAQHDHRQQNAEFPCKQLAQRRPDAGIGKGQRDGSLQHALWAEVFAEERITHAHIVYKERRQQEDHHQQYSVFER